MKKGMFNPNKDIKKIIELKPVINKKNNQINFSLCKKKLPKIIKDNLSSLKSIKINTKDFEFEDKWKEW